MDRRDLRSGNILLLKKLLKEHRSATKPQLSKLSGLSVVTVNAIMKILVAEGIAEEQEAAPSTGGRPAIMYSYRLDRRLALSAFSVADNTEGAKDKLIIAVDNIFGETQDKEEILTDAVTPTLFVEKLRPFLEKYPQIPMISVGLSAKHSIEFQDLPELNDMPLERYLTAKTSRPVQLTGEIDAATVGCGSLFGKFAENEVIIGIHWPNLTPPVAGITMHGQLYKGKDGIAGQIGKRFFGSAYHKPLDIVREAARIVVMLTRTFNPHGLVIYSDELLPEHAAVITERAGREIPAKFLPTIIMRESLTEDYKVGMKILAMKHLATFEENL